MTLIELVLGIAILVIVALSVYRAFGVLFSVLTASKMRVAVATAANEQIELIRNLSYSSVGIIGGIPPGILPQNQILTKSGLTFSATTTVREIDDPFDGTLGGNPNDSAPSDYKFVELRLQCVNCLGGNSEIFKFTARAAPKGLETATTNGALFVQAFDANGVPVQGASVQVVNNKLSPPVNLTDVTDATGFLRLIDVRPAAQSYQITVSKNGYSTDKTYATSTSNPNPTKPNATVALQQVTQISFAIDRVSSMNISSVNQMCEPVPSLSFGLSGAKLIGTNPNVLKFSQSYATDAGGQKALSGLEWDTYLLGFSSGSNVVAGTIPLSPITLVPNAAQNVKIVTQPSSPQNLLVTVEDGATGLPLSSATVSISGGSYANALITGRGFLRQTDWSGGEGQDIVGDPFKYFNQDGNIETMGSAGNLTLKLVASSTYASSGYLTSSIFDTGSPSTFFNFTFTPLSQSPQTGIDPVKFQAATATTTMPASWDYKGPDGTTATYYTTSNTSINPVHNNDRYIRYRAFLGTASTTYTPILSDVAITFASDCVPPGQVLFQGLPSNTYNITVARSGYQTINDLVTVNQSWQEYVAAMHP